ncbi:MAG: hypothetical protein GX760_05020 [Erysipelothrix sp.]|nr:hypothetical protein [Erysipelothrix sp.]
MKKAMFKKQTLQIKAIIAYFIFNGLYTFVLALLLPVLTLLQLPEDFQYNIVLMILYVIVAGTPFILSGYLIMLGRNSHADLKRRNTLASIQVFLINIMILCVIGMIHIFLPHLGIDNIYITLYYTMLRMLLVVPLSPILEVLIMFIASLMGPLYMYIGGQIRLKTLNKGE